MSQKKSEWSQRYWEKRRELEDSTRLKAENSTLDELIVFIPNAMKEIQQLLLSQADLHELTINELLKDYSLRDQKKYRKYIDKNYRELMKVDDQYKEFIDEYFPSYDYAKINRLLQLRSDIFSILASKAIEGNINQLFANRLINFLENIYQSNSNALGMILGTGDFSALSSEELKRIVNYPWSGKSFSKRLWGNISRLEQNLTQAILDALMSGERVESIIRRMRGNKEVSSMFKLEKTKFRNALENLVRTEYAHIAVEGVKKSVNDAGIKQLQSWSAEDERVCVVCGARHGKLIEDGWYPPYHGRCRCTAIPKMPELGKDIDSLYEEMFGDLLDEFANEQFNIKLKTKAH